MSKIIIKTNEQINNIRESGKYLTELLNILKLSVKSWMTLLDLEIIACDYIKKHNLKWAFKWYQWFPANLCLSVNDCLVHWIPDKYVLKDWDLLKIDAWIIYNWWFSDAAISVIVGWEDKNPQWFKLIKSTKNALDNSISFIFPWNSVYDFSYNIQRNIKLAGFSVIKYLTWHWVGVAVHEPPHIMNWANVEMKSIILKPWMVLALEPITAIKSDDFIEKKWNEWNLYTKYWDLWAQWEYTVLITEKGNEILAWIV